ncbi:glutamyl-tRNA reductase [Scopulibacillus darangshiensis]|uniref:Glutamyl-tRNA reductase n=1 Tax=Scopulibacillus darangshiensis TaxID=442528 RepID=A0A4R2PAV6_9BACL|nr:glutamyl-tRNA reductase [Scopulibacillus darangshiensis]TCP32220.1 glutamyl-tRNA reductase [Scopulibacillus darangshiensis]
MHILSIGINHRTAPVNIREKFTFDASTLHEALIRLRHTKSIFEDVIVSTCNRTEIFVVADQLHTGRHYTKTFLAEWFGIEKEQLTPFLFIKEDEGAIEHLFRVTCGLDSMILGETQILGQIRDGFLTAQGHQTTGTIFNELFKEAITLAKRAHSETAINDNAVSVSYAAVELAKQIFGRLDDKHILIVGAGKMSELTAKHLDSQGVSKITVMNRTVEKALELAKRFSGQAAKMSEMAETLADADILISSTGSRDTILHSDFVKKAVKQRKGRPLFMVDIAVPRDIEPAINDIDGVFLYDIDDLEGIVQANLADRKEAALQIELFIEEQLMTFKQWLQTLGVVPVISALRKKALNVQAETMKSIERKIPDLSDRERKVINKHTKSIVNQLLRDPIQKAKELAAGPDANASLQMLIDIFAIEDDVQEEKDLQDRKERAKQVTLDTSKPKTAESDAAKVY